MSRMHKRPAGFTLLEMLIAMTLLGFILAVLFGGLRLGSRSWDAGDARAEKTVQLAQLQDFLRREITQLRPYTWQKTIDHKLAFSGAAERLMMVAPIDVHLGPGGLFLVSLDLNEGKLVLRQAPVTADSEDFSALDDSEDTVLADHVAALQFSYYGAETKDANADWVDSWESMDTPERLPFMIRVHIEFDDGRQWPDLVATPLLGSDTGCVWDEMNGRCANV